MGWCPFCFRARAHPKKGLCFWQDARIWLNPLPPPDPPNFVGVKQLHWRTVFFQSGALSFLASRFLIHPFPNPESRIEANQGKTPSVEIPATAESDMCLNQTRRDQKLKGNAKSFSSCEKALPRRNPSLAEIEPTKAFFAGRALPQMRVPTGHAVRLEGTEQNDILDARKPAPNKLTSSLGKWEATRFSQPTHPFPRCLCGTHPFPKLQANSSSAERNPGHLATRRNPRASDKPSVNSPSPCAFKGAGSRWKVIRKGPRFRSLRFFRGPKMIRPVQILLVVPMKRGVDKTNGRFNETWLRAPQYA